MAYGLQNAPQGIQPYSSITGGSWVDKLNQYYIDPTFNDARLSVNGFPSFFNGDPVRFCIQAPTALRPVTGIIQPYAPSFTDAAPSTFADEAALGAFVSCEYFDVSGKYIVDNKFIGGTPTYLDAAGNQTLVKAFVSDDPQVVYDVQVSSQINNLADVLPFTSPTTFPNVNTDVGDDLEGGVGSNFALGIGDNAYTGAHAYPLATTGFDLITIPGQGIKYANNPATGSAVSGQSAYYLNVSTWTGGVNTHDYQKIIADLPLKVVGITPNNTVLPKVGADTYTLATTPFINVLVIINDHTYGHGEGQTGHLMV